MAIPQMGWHYPTSEHRRTGKIQERTKTGWIATFPKLARPMRIFGLAYVE
jgi:hypothetical protein